ncbi:phage capsid protein [Pseudoduganella lutea]|uniref:Capsid protein n=1 Tax=Pseudoduganella lutea TaxID=321985 RepID=A0A4P6L5E1_9BURK|nr:phage capsid protein [Pseudoduganella lutea]QBE66840.1 capsid protein [Pseudoduganella lutea]
MANMTPARILQNNLAGDAKALALKVFAGEVLTAYETKRVASRYVRNRQITAGKSASFPVLGKASGGYHTPGTEINGRPVASSEVVITIDDLLESDVSIANYDEAMSHFDVRSEYSSQMGIFLANTEDKQLLQLAILAARSAARITGEPGGSVITAGSAGTDAEALIASAFAAAQKFDEKDVPEDDRAFFVRPAQYYLLAQSTKLMNKDWGGQGVYVDGKVLRVAGMEIVKTNNLPSANVATGTTDAGSNNTYAGNFSTTVALALQKAALGSVTLMDLAMDAEYEARYQATLMVAKFAKGYGILAPQAAIEIKTA